MSDWAATITASFVGAFFGSLGAVWLRHRLQSARELRHSRAELARRHLYQFQDSVESLWYRFDNLTKRGGRFAMTGPYFETTSLYSLGRVLACERLLALSGVYPQLELSFPGLGEELRSKRLDDELQGQKFNHYDRLALAEAVIERDAGEPRLSTYLEFRSRYERHGSSVHAWLEESLSFVRRLAKDKDKMSEFQVLLRDIAAVLEEHTGIPTSIAPAAAEKSGAV